MRKNAHNTHNCETRGRDAGQQRPKGTSLPVPDAHPVRHPKCTSFLSQAYKIPGFRDVPQEFNVSLLKDVQWENLRTIQRSRGVGEPPLFLGSAVFFAIRDALKAAREQWGCRDVLSLRSPATVERIRISCADPILKRAEVTPREGEKSFFIAI